MLTDKDINKLIRLPNKLLSDYHARVMIDDVPESICQFYEENAEKIKGDVVVVRTSDDAPKAAHARNTKDKVLFVFWDRFWVTSYFSSVCQRIELPKTLIVRSLK